MSVVSYIQQVQGCWQGAGGAALARLLTVDDASRPKMPAGQQGLQVSCSGLICRPMRFSHHSLGNRTTRQRLKRVRRSATSHCWRMWSDITSPRRHGPGKGGILRHMSTRSSAKGPCRDDWRTTALLNSQMHCSPRAKRQVILCSWRHSMSISIESLGTT